MRAIMATSPPWTLSAVALALLAIFIPTVLCDYCLPTRGCWPRQSSVEKWKASLTNTTILTPDGTPAEYLHSVVEMNTLKSAAPAMVVMPGNEEDVAKTLVWATKKRIRVVAKCSGHDLNARSTGYGIIQMNMQRGFKSMSYDDKSGAITIGSGVNHAEAYTFAAAHNRVVVGGKAPSVCPTGCILGACHGPLTRKHGLGLDNVLSIRLALSNGTITTASPTHNPALFNALLGSGHSTYGIVLALTLASHPAPPRVSVVSGGWELPTSLEQPNILTTFVLNASWWATALPDSFAVYVSVREGLLGGQFVYTGDDYSEVPRLLDPLLVLPSFRWETLWGANFSSVAEAALAGAEGSGDADWARKMLVNILVPPQQPLLEVLAQTLVDLGSSANVDMVYTYGGQAAKGTAGSINRGLRSAMFEVMAGAGWQDVMADEANMATANAAAEVLYPLSPASYVNEYTTWFNKSNVIGDWRTRFYDDYQALLKVKKEVDPCNMFTVEYGVGSDMPPATC